MAATPKHRRSASKARSTRASDRYDVVLKKFRKMKKKGGSVAFVSKETGKLTEPHRVSKENNVYRGHKIIENK
jgi:ribosomal protein L32